jgi:hypothetical protein
MLLLLIFTARANNHAELIMINSFDPLTGIPSLRRFGIQHILNLIHFWISIPRLDRMGGCNNNKLYFWEM